MPEIRDITDEHPNFQTDEGEGWEARSASGDEAANALRAAVRAGHFRNELDADLRIFTAPNDKETKFLIFGGEVIWFRDTNAPLGRKDVDRGEKEIPTSSGEYVHIDGDVWAEFHGGICATRDPLVIEWLEAHSGDQDRHEEYFEKYAPYFKALGINSRTDPVEVGLCRDCDNPATPMWAELKGLTVPTSRRSAQLPVSMDLDKMFNRLDTFVGDTDEGERVKRAVKNARAADESRNRGK